MNTYTERFLTFAETKVVTEEGFYYYFTDNEIEFLPQDSEFSATISFTGELIARYTQYELIETVVETEKTFDAESVKVPDIIAWLKSTIK